jgi:hypothetical protein
MVLSLECLRFSPPAPPRVRTLIFYIPPFRFPAGYLRGQPDRIHDPVLNWGVSPIPTGSGATR